MDEATEATIVTECGRVIFKLCFNFFVRLFEQIDKEQRRKGVRGGKKKKQSLNSQSPVPNLKLCSVFVPSFYL